MEEHLPWHLQAVGISNYKVANSEIATGPVKPYTELADTFKANLGSAGENGRF